MSSPRRSSIRQRRAIAAELPIAPKTFELEQRISRVEQSCKELEHSLQVIFKRVTALQAHVDHLVAKLSLIK